jgi:phosphoribosylformylglycinamidine cyclo-ligase
VHSNGLSLARRAFFGGAKPHPIDHRFADLDVTLGEELLKPTLIFVPEALEILSHVGGVKALINITSDGLLNLARVAAPVGFVIDRPLGAQPIFALIQAHAGVDDAEMHEVFNLGIGFCYVVAARDADATLAILKQHGRTAARIGYAVADAEKKVRIPPRGLVGRHKKFRKER